MTGHGPEECVEGRGLLAEEVPGGVVRRGSLRDLIVWRRLDGMDQIRELRSILNEEDRGSIPDDIEVALVRVAKRSVLVPTTTTTH